MASYAIDDSAILYLAQMGPDHSNVYRFTIALTEPVVPELLQRAAERIYTRFPTIFAGFVPGNFTFCVVSAKRAPQVQQDPGLLKTMGPAELEDCACRIYHDGCLLIMEAFHALTDGYGAMTAFRTLAAEYLHLRYGVHSPERREMLEQGEPDWEAELQDAYLAYAQADPSGMPNRHAYQMKGKDRSWQVKTEVARFSTAELLKTARSHGVSMTALLSGLMAEAIMELQQKQSSGKQLPVRIMVPVDLRRQFPSRTLRNFILYALPSMEPEDRQLPRRERLQRFHRQLLSQTTREALAGQISRNVRLQRSCLFRAIPRAVKCGAMRLAYRFCGECNSSITLTNLGLVQFSEELKPYVQYMDVHLTPRRQSPYNCGLLSVGDVTSISISRFGAEPELEPLFFGKLRGALKAE